MPSRRRFLRTRTLALLLATSAPLALSFGAPGTLHAQTSGNTQTSGTGNANVAVRPNGHTAPAQSEDYALDGGGLAEGGGNARPWTYRYGGPDFMTSALARLYTEGEGVKIARGGILDGPNPRGGHVEIPVFYEAKPGPDHGYGGFIIIHRIGEEGSYPTHVYVDDKQVDSFITSHAEERRELKAIFGPDLAGLRKASCLRVAMEIDGASYDILDLDLNGGGNVRSGAVLLSGMADGADRNYREIYRRQHPEKGKDCFLTTACCDLMGLPDDCFELTALRRFRDTVMRVTPDGQRDIERYYALAPRLLAEMHARGEERRLLGVYFCYILPCALAAHMGFVAPTHRHYARMIRRLVARYLPERSAAYA